jgi:sterol desaturase/sphingolipid hydroxylase (fatty acid hydroxylase superfamily)
MPPTTQGLVIGFVVLFLIFRALQWLRPREKRLAVLRRGFWTDLAYWAFTPIVTRAITRLSVIIVIVPVALLAYGKVDKDLLANGFGPASRLPLWVQAAGILVLGDFIGYWMHRAFHGRRLWRFHAVHHSSVDLDWLSSVRLHPVNDALMRIAGTVPILALGSLRSQSPGSSPC